MKFDFCPGSSKFRRPKPEIIKCSSCGEEVEIWSDEIRAICPGCKKTVMRELGASCFDWCKYAKECAGEQAYSQYIQNKAITIKNKLIKELVEYFGNDTKRINHAKKVMHFAEELLEKEGGDWHIVIPASILHDVGIKVAENKFGSAAGKYQEKEGPDIAKGILLKIGFMKEDIEQICKIIANHHSPGKINTQNFKVLYDADSLVNFKDEADLDDKESLKEKINKVFLTMAGKELAQEIYLRK